MDYNELEKRILEKLGADSSKIPASNKFLVNEEYKITYCIVQALVEYDKMRQENNKD